MAFIIWFSMLTFPVSVDRSSPPITFISPVDWSFCQEIIKQGSQYRIPYWFSATSDLLTH